MAARRKPKRRAKPRRAPHAVIAAELPKRFTPVPRMTVDEFCKPRKPAKVSLSRRVSPEIKQRLAGLAVSTGLSQTEILERLIKGASPATLMPITTRIAAHVCGLFPRLGVYRG